MIPTSGRSPLIVSASNAPEIFTTVSLKDLTIDSSASLTISSSGVLNINGTLRNRGTIAVNGTVTVG